MSPGQFESLHRLPNKDKKILLDDLLKDREGFIKYLKRYPVELEYTSKIDGTYFRIVFQHSEAFDWLTHTLELFLKFENLEENEDEDIKDD